MELSDKENLPKIVLILYISLEHMGSFKSLFCFQTEVGTFFLGVAIFFLCVGSLFVPKVFEKGAYWVVLALFLTFELFLKRSFAANSSYLIVYFMIAFALSFKEVGQEGQRAFWSDSARLLLFVTLFYAGLQKVFSPHYIEGNLLTSVHMKKGFFHWVLSIRDSSFLAAAREFSKA